MSGTSSTPAQTEPTAGQIEVLAWRVMHGDGLTKDEKRFIFDKLMALCQRSETTDIHSEVAKLNALFPLLWHINDHLKVTPDQRVEYTGSTNDVDSLRDALHRLDPEFARGTMP